ncbi:hypothetical protein VA249_46090 (plasmid) [Vibrio alfacsensis]|uniref:hypothetical protein n=1 Tax=Vibrio alfacsensis TaxID=1074311 RepID=UPI001BF0C1E9|nr:hypothetical protein [Vibrio alfacsensis]BBM67963.1 hypothetical protein VA249_46090 [Vibrio alfacsensis]
MPQLSSDEAFCKPLSVYETTKLTSNMTGRSVKTRNGIAVIVRVITSQQWLHIRYSDGSIGWVGVGQFEFIE